MPVQPYLGKYVVFQGVTQETAAWAPDFHLLCPTSGRRLANRMRIEAIPGYDRYTKGLEVGAIYSWKTKREEAVIDEGLGFYSFLAKLALLVGHDWRAENPPGRPGPFFELLRYGLQRAHMSSFVARKLLHDFDDWEARVEAVGDSDFLAQYRKTEALIFSARFGALYFDGVPEPEPYDFRRLTGLIFNGCGDDDQI
ncbi:MULTISPECIES: hypothetical protein [Pandoraea]|uniref:Uncharacterized protein n=1 Tax=Pandoraea pneumonica TaxID=2508299 RepID=A0A5E4RGI2_9BURK|nr:MULTISPECIES: hypothetical protein [Pandoraea]VVD62285.1 hypothetical protein PPN31114_00162 [Pandoraea pneumonica]